MLQILKLWGKSKIYCVHLPRAYDHCEWIDSYPKLNSLSIHRCPIVRKYVHICSWFGRQSHHLIHSSTFFLARKKTHTNFYFFMFKFDANTIFFRGQWFRPIQYFCLVCERIVRFCSRSCENRQQKQWTSLHLRVYIYIPESFTSLCVFRIRDSVVPMKIKLRTHEKWRQLCLTSPFCLICFVAETPEHLMSFTVSRGT